MVQKNAVKLWKVLGSVSSCLWSLAAEGGMQSSVLARTLLSPISPWQETAGFLEVGHEVQHHSPLCSSPFFSPVARSPEVPSL